MWVKIGNIRGAAGADGKKIEVKVASGFLLWRHIGDSVWQQLISLDELQGKAGLDGRSITDFFINSSGELIITDSDKRIKNLGNIRGKGGKDGTDGKAGRDGLNGMVGSGLPIGGNKDYFLLRNDTGLAGSAVWGNLDDAVGSTGELGQHIVPNPLKPSGVAWQTIGFSYLTDETGAILTDEAGNALEGKDTVDALLLVNDKPTLLELTFADTGITLTRPDNGKTIIDVDCTNGVVIINLYPKATFDEIEIKKTDVSGNKITYRGNGDDTVDDLAERDISAQYTTDRLVGGSSQWGRR